MVRIRKYLKGILTKETQ